MHLGRIQVEQPDARDRPARAPRSRSNGASDPGSPASRPYHARSWATSTISRRRCRPGRAPLRRSTPADATVAYHGTTGSRRTRTRDRSPRRSSRRPTAPRARRGGSSSRSRTPVGAPGSARGPLPTHHPGRRGDRRLPRETHDGVELGQRLGQLGARPFGEAAGGHERGSGLASRCQRQDRLDRLLAAASMKAQVLTTTRSASPTPSAGTRRRAASRRSCPSRPRSSGSRASPRRTGAPAQDWKRWSPDHRTGAPP